MIHSWTPGGMNVLSAEGHSVDAAAATTMHAVGRPVQKAGDCARTPPEGPAAARGGELPRGWAVHREENWGE